MDQHDFNHFLAAQADTYELALAELRAGAKRSHWMWFVFPQVAGLGHSAMAARYAIRDLPAARAYLAHPILGPRLSEAAAAMLAAASADPVAILGEVDALKLKSSMTLFALAGDDPAFAGVLDRFYAGARDQVTLRLIDRS